MLTKTLSNQSFSPEQISAICPGAAINTTYGSSFNLQEKLGTGGQGIVFKATTNLDNQPMAVKLPSHNNDQSINDLIETEANVLGQLNHPNIVKLRESGATSSGDRYLALELVNGITLKQLLNGQSQLERSTIFHLCLQIADALRYSHEHDIVHCDLKPSNIMVDKNYSHATLLDFGISYSPQSLAQSHDELIYGTLFYMSPEQIMGEVITEKSDIYQLGLVLHELLYGYLPFELNTEAAIAFRLTGDGVPDSNKWQQSKQLSFLLKKMLARVPDERFKNMEEVIQALRALIVADEESKASRSTPGG